MRRNNDKTFMKNTIVQSESGFVWLHRFLDLIAPAIILTITLQAFSYPAHDRYSLLGILAGLIFVVSAQAIGLYKNWRGRPSLGSSSIILRAWLITWVTLIVLTFLYKNSSEYSRLTLATWALVTPVFLIIYRLTIRAVLKKLNRKSGYANRVLIIGAGKVGNRLAETLNSSPWLGYTTVGFLDDNVNLSESATNSLPVFGTTDTLLETIIDQQINEVYICLPMRAEIKIKQILEKLSDSAVVVKFVPDFFTFDLMHAKWTDWNGTPVVSVFDSPLSSRTARILKRTEDILISSMILMLISPLLLLIAVAIKLDSSGPAIFKQTRYGINGKPIKIYKFRTMNCTEDGSNIRQASSSDSRITPVGKFLRRTSLDELPQFFNVIQGKMSVVGPRPHAVAHNEEYRKIIPRYMQRHMVKPGITGWAQINGWRGETDTLDKMQKRVDYDLHYINNWSVWLDFQIVFLTIVKGFVHKNAY